MRQSSKKFIGNLDIFKKKAKKKLNYFSNLLDTAIFPLKLIIPQPIIKKIPGLSSNKDLRIRNVLKHLKGYCLDIGCGNNKLIHSYRNVGGKGLGVDVYPWQGVDRVLKNTSQLHFDNDSIDTISFVACLNHIPNRVNVLKEVHRIIKPEGKLLITNLSPLISSVWHRWAFWDKDQHERGMEEGEVYGFTTQELSEILSKAGFTITKIERFAWKINQLYICKPKAKNL